MKLLTAFWYAGLATWFIIFLSVMSVYLEKKKQERINEDRLHKALVEFIIESAKEDVE